MSHNLTKAQIVAAAQENVGRGSELDSICDVRLNLLMEQLFEAYITDVQLKTTSITLSDKTWTPPTDYIKPQFLKYIDTDSNANQPPNVPIPLLSYVDYQSFLVPDTTGSPLYACITRTIDSTGEIVLQGYVYPKPDKTYTGTITYWHKPDFDTADAEAIRWFNTAMIVDLLTNELRGMGYDDVGGTPYNRHLMETIIRRTRENMVQDEGIYPRIARLDRRVFKKPVNVITNQRHSRIVR